MGADVLNTGDRVRAELDEWLPRPAVRVVHRRTSSATADQLWAAASSLRLDESPVLGRLVRWRIPGLAGDLRFDQLFREPPFLVLAEEESALISGLAGRIWTLRRDYPQLADAEEFRAWSQRGTARVVIATWAQTASDGTSTLESEARVQGLGAQGQVGVAAVRPLVRGAQHLVGTEAMRAAVRRAEGG